MSKRDFPASEEPSITILHVSDMQFGRHHRFGRLALGGADEKFDSLLTRLCDDLDLMKKTHGVQPDVVVLTGDLSEWGLKREFDDVLAFIDGLSKHLQRGRERFLVIPGNHDINRKKCESFFNDFAAEGNKEEDTPKPYWPKWKFYADFFSALYEKVPQYQFTEREPWTLFEIPELHTIFAGMNSTIHESHREQDHHGWLGETQIRWFQNKLMERRAQGWLCVGLVHHNVVRRAESDDENLRDADDLAKYMVDTLHFLLHGHTHQGQIESLRDLPIFSTGSAGVKQDQRPEEMPNQYQVLRVRRNGIWCGARQYTSQRKAWIGDTRISKIGNDWYFEKELKLDSAFALFPPVKAAAPPVESRAAGDADKGANNLEREFSRIKELVWDQPTTHEYDDLLKAVMSVCELRSEGRGIKLERVLHRGPWGHYARVLEPGRSAYALGAVAGVLTDEVLKLWIQDVHEPFSRRPAQLGARSELIVACEGTIPTAIKTVASQHGVQVERWIDYQRILDVDGYRDRLRQRLEGDLTYPLARYMEQRITAMTPGVDHKEINTAADWLVNRLIDPLQGAFLLVLGPAGVGKTFLLRKVAHLLSTTQRLVTPLLIDLRNLESAQDVPQLVATHFAQQGLVFPPKAFERDLREGRIALLFDGFDELALRVRSAAVPAHFERLTNAAWDQAKIVVTSRTEHFLTDGDAEHLMTRSPSNITASAGIYLAVARRRLVNVKPFERSDIERYLIRRLGRTAGLKRFHLMSSLHDLVGMAANPRMLGFLVDIPDAQLETARKRADALTSAELYHLVIDDAWLKGEAERLNPPGSAPGPTQESLRDAATQLALHMWTRRSTTIDAGSLGSHIDGLLKQLCDGDQDRATTTLRERTLLTRDRNGKFQFVHQTVLEWLVAMAIAEELKETGHSEHLGMGGLTKLIIDFLRDYIDDDNKLAAWAQDALDQSQTDLRAENARSVLKQMGRKARQKADLRNQDLRGQDLGGQDLVEARLDGADMRGMRLVGWDLTRASLVGAKLSHADLSNCTLRDADLTDADLSFARLHRTTITRLKLDRAKLLGASFLGSRGTPSVDVMQVLPKPLTVHNSTEGAASRCRTVAFDGHGYLLASGHDDGTIRLWDAVEGRLLRMLSGHTGPILSIAFSPDAHTLASGGFDKTVRLWDAEAGESRQELRGHTGSVWSVAFSPDGRSLASGASDKVVRLWTVHTGGPLQILSGHQGPVWSVAFSPDGSWLASGADDKTVRLWIVDEGVLVRVFPGHGGPVRSVAFSPDGRSLASASDDKTVRLWDTATARRYRVLSGHEGLVWTVAFSSDGRSLASGAADKTVRIWDTATAKTLRVLAEHEGSVWSVAFSSDGRSLASGSSDKTLRLWNTETGKTVRLLSGHSGSAWNVFLSDERAVATRVDDKSLRLLTSEAGNPIRVLSGHEGSIWSVAVSSTGQHIASGADDKTVRLWDAERGNCIQILSGHKGSVWSVAFSPNRLQIASGAEDKTVRLWSTETGKLLHVLSGHEGPVRSLAFSPTNRMLASGADDHTVRLWDEETGELLYTLAGHERPVRSLAFSPANRMLASGADDHSVRLWIRTTVTEAVASDYTVSADKTRRPWTREIVKLQRSLHHHAGPILSVAFSPDGHTLASSSEDKTVCQWEADTGKLIRVLRGHEGPVTQILFTQDKRRIRTSSQDGTMRLWDLQTGECLVALLRTERGAIEFRPDGRYKSWGDVGGQFWHTVGLHRYEVGELDEFVPGGLRLPEGESLFHFTSVF